ncbi:hypothetical protein ACROYT_G029493 [Oculina patagonica]
MAVFDVGPVLEGVTSLQGILEEAITKSKLLIEAIEGSQSKYSELNEEYPVLRSLKGRLAASQGPNESLSTELVKFKLNLETFVENVFNAHDQVRKDLELWAKELERDREKLRREKAEFLKEREKFDLERKEYSDGLRIAATRKPEIEENTDNTEKSEEQLFDKNITENNEKLVSNSKSTFCKQETCDAECQTEHETYLNEESQNNKEQDLNQLNESLAANDILVHENLGKENQHLLPCRLQVRSAAVNGRVHQQRALTAPVSRAKALLLTKQGHALRIHKTLLDGICEMKEEIQYLKTENSALLKKANEASSELFYMKNKLVVNIADRDELQKKLQRSKEQIQKLEETLRKQATGLVYNKKQQKQLQEEIRWKQIFAVPPHVPFKSRGQVKCRGISQEEKSTRGCRQQHTY